MANPCGRDKCAGAMQQCAASRCLPLPRRGGANRNDHFALSLGLVTWPYHLVLEAASFLQSERNFLRSLPCSPLASASLEHSSEAAVRGFSAFFSVAAGAAAGAEVCA